MSLGIKSLWRVRSRSSAFAGSLLISRDLLPSKVPNPYRAILRFESTTTQSETTYPATSSGTALVALPDSSDASLQASESPNDAAPELVTASLVADEAPESRNRVFKDAFRIEAARAAEDKDALKAHKPLIGKPQQYPNEAATKASVEEHQRDARRQLGLGIVWGHFNKRVRQWMECFHLMKRMTPQWSDRANMSAVRIVLPKTWDIEVNNENLAYVDSATGVLQKLRAAVDKNPSAIVLRGQSSVLVKVADEIVRYCKEAEIYELGEVATSDYKTRQLWPTIQNAPNGGASLPGNHVDTIWMHKEYQPHDITVPYEKIPRPDNWTTENFEQYIATLVYGRVPSHLAIPFYGERRMNGRNIDTDGIRIGLIVEAFEDPAARPFITAPVLKMAISMMAFRGGHRASANVLVQLGEQLGTPMDTDIYNIMLEGYAHKRDIGFFYGFLRKMQAQYFHPNIRTWLLFLQLIRGEDERRQVIVAMYELGMFNHAATRRGIADVMASLDAYAAFKAGRSLKGFLADQKERYGEGWLAIDGLNGIITELLRFHRPEDPRVKDCKTLVKLHTEAGHRIDLKTINIFLKHAAMARDWNTALWALSLLKDAGSEPSQETYTALMSLSIRTRAPQALGTVYFYGVLHRKLKKEARQMLSKVLLRSHHDAFWNDWQHQPGIFPKDAIADLEESKIPRLWAVMSRVERVILDRWAGYVPIKPLERSLELAYTSNDQPMHHQMRAGKHPQVQDLVVKLRRVDGQEGNINVRLKGRFNPLYMIEDWPEHLRQRAEEQESAEQFEAEANQEPEPTSDDLEASPQGGDDPALFTKAYLGELTLRLTKDWDEDGTYQPRESPRPSQEKEDEESSGPSPNS
ncbi:hypothetical protein FZEAL_6282 [Fusarium zealandicum]|uniref:Pentatricopeptide repeat protein n=1 Tax=Fusarium zealandicum TaxID=1053134 RepID=A0A8H4UI89_9HYPO|nr:hypothetical protein FZEAL_6282 [Fusarium zealandicum]